MRYDEPRLVWTGLPIMHYFVLSSLCISGCLRTRKALRASQQGASGPGWSLAEVALATPIS
jgi:hypothetical protein